MTNTADKIAEIINTPTPSAPITTHALAELGNGSMQNGLKRIVSYFVAESASNLRLGRIQGGVAGIIGTAATVVTIAIIYQHSQKKQIEKEGKKIISILQQSPSKDTKIIEKAAQYSPHPKDTSTNKE